MRRPFGAAMLASALIVVFLPARAPAEPFRPQTPEAMEQAMQELAKSAKGYASLGSIGKSAGGRDLRLLTLGKAGSEAPAVWVVGNVEGDTPFASEAALRLAAWLVKNKRDATPARRWYILPVAHPDAYAAFFTRPAAARFVNARALDDDNDGAIDEDGPEDLNGDGLITSMREKHPEGTWMPAEGNPILMKKAEAAKGERGVYRLHTEGKDDDGDGKINEDGPGGAVPGWNFPHAFKHYTARNGPWAASEPETRALLRFGFDHPEIALLITLGRGNNLYKIPESTQKKEDAGGKYKLPERVAKAVDIDPEQEFTLKELVEMGREYTGNPNLTEDMVLMFLGVGAAVNPHMQDLPYWTELNKRYKDFIKKAGLPADRVDPKPSPPGSLQEWGYYQYGVPSFSLDLWALPKKKKKPAKTTGELPGPDEIEAMTAEEFIALGKEKIAAMLEATGQTRFTPEMVIQALRAGMVTPKKIAEGLKKLKEREEAGGIDPAEQALYDSDPGAFVAWKPYDHPTLGRIEIGGKRPWADGLPPAGKAGELLDKQFPFVWELAGLLPEVVIDRVDVERRAADVWRVEAWVTNRGFLPYPTFQGERCKRPAPVAVTLEGAPVIQGRKRVTVPLLPGSGGAHKVSWVVRAGAGSRVSLKTFTYAAGRHEHELVLKGKVRR